MVEAVRWQGCGKTKRYSSPWLTSNSFSAYTSEGGGGKADRVTKKREASGPPHRDLCSLDFITKTIELKISIAISLDFL